MGWAMGWGMAAAVAVARLRSESAGHLLDESPPPIEHGALLLREEATHALEESLGGRGLGEVREGRAQRAQLPAQRVVLANAEGVATRRRRRGEAIAHLEGDVVVVVVASGGGGGGALRGAPGGGGGLVRRRPRGG